MASSGSILSVMNSIPASRRRGQPEESNSPAEGETFEEGLRRHRAGTPADAAPGHPRRSWESRNGQRQNRASVEIASPLK
jgi:hypothetical protein